VPIEISRLRARTLVTRWGASGDHPPCFPAWCRQRDRAGIRGAAQAAPVLV